MRYLTNDSLGQMGLEEAIAWEQLRGQGLGSMADNGDSGYWSDTHDASGSTIDRDTSGGCRGGKCPPPKPAPKPVIKYQPPKPAAPSSGYAVQPGTRYGSSEPPITVGSQLKPAKCGYGTPCEINTPTQYPVARAPSEPWDKNIPVYTGPLICPGGVCKPVAKTPPPQVPSTNCDAQFKEWCSLHEKYLDQKAMVKLFTEKNFGAADIRAANLRASGIATQMANLNAVLNTCDKARFMRGVAGCGSGPVPTVVVPPSVTVTQSDILVAQPAPVPQAPAPAPAPAQLPYMPNLPPVISLPDDTNVYLPRPVTPAAPVKGEPSEQEYWADYPGEYAKIQAAQAKRLAQAAARKAEMDRLLTVAPPSIWSKPSLYRSTGYTASRSPVALPEKFTGSETAAAGRPIARAWSISNATKAIADARKYTGEKYDEGKVAASVAWDSGKKSVKAAADAFTEFSDYFRQVQLAPLPSARSVGIDTTYQNDQDFGPGSAVRYAAFAKGTRNIEDVYRSYGKLKDLQSKFKKDASKQAADIPSGTGAAIQRYVLAKYLSALMGALAETVPAPNRTDGERYLAAERFRNLYNEALMAAAGMALNYTTEVSKTGRSPTFEAAMSELQQHENQQAKAEILRRRQERGLEASNIPAWQQ